MRCDINIEDKNIRVAWNEDEENWYFSVVDVVGILTDNDYQKSRNYLGEITRKYPVHLKKWALENGENDDVLDDSGMVINTENGIIVIAGCSHSGICNIVEQAKKVSNNSKVLAVIGGFHLREVDENTNKVIDYMKNNVKEVILAHCTADSVCNKFVNDLKGKIKVSATEVGKIYNF